MEIRKLLRSYGIRNFNLSNSTQIMVMGMSAILALLSPIHTFIDFSSPDIDTIHPKTRLANVFR